jgi:hypothetical protein
MGLHVARAGRRAAGGSNPGVNPDVFVGYPQLASELFRPRKKLFNAACPGETSTSLITGTRPDNGCQDYRQFIGALHVAYSGSQLQYGERYVAANPRTGLITMMIGANDLFLLLDSCAGDVGCVLARFAALLDTLKANLITIYSGLRQAGFEGEFVAVTYYSLNYSDPVGTGIIEAIDGVLAGVTQAAFGGKVADGFGAFQAAAAAFGGDSCAAGLLIRLTATTCDVHPSPAGAALLAQAVDRRPEVVSIHRGWYQVTGCPPRASVDQDDIRPVSANLVTQAVQAR